MHKNIIKCACGSNLCKITAELFDNDLEIAWDVYNKVIDDYATKVYNEKIKPWLIKNKLTFLSGNGTFYIYKEVKGKKIKEYNIDDIPCEIPKDILNILNMEIPGYSNNTLGTIMHNFHYDKWKNKTEVKMYL